MLAAWLGLLLAVVSRPEGVGIPLCWLFSGIGIPCPGCGLTRSLACGLRGLFGQSLQAHPMGLLVLALFIFTAGQGLLPAAYRARIQGFMDRHDTVLKVCYFAAVAVFLTFGVVRALVALGSRVFH